MNTPTTNTDTYNAACPRCDVPPGQPCTYRGKPKEGYAHSERYDASEKERAREILRGILSKGDTVYTLCRHVSASGMSRRLDLYTISEDASSGAFLRYLTGYVATALGYQRHRSGAVVVGGCGMDMGFHLVHNLSYALHGMSSHDAKGSDRSGYTLKQEWI